MATANILPQIRAKLVTEWVRRYRAQNPRSRAESPYRIVVNTGCRRIYESLVDGTRISMSAKYPITKRIWAWMAEQDAAAAAQILAWAEQDAA